ncbi:MAG: hypothetical protein M1376_11525 [Planctomycetes bacterium]|nr:hypothetical protein [Planctomycetota bacterium]
MSSQTAKLELTIVAAALLVLVLCRQPPKSGNADVRTDVDTATQEVTPGTEDAAQETNSGPASDPLPPADEQRTPGLQTPTITPSPNSITPDNSSTDSTVPSQSQKRMGMVDARNCGRLKYKDVLYGKVSVRWVWDGEKLVPHQVIEVKEKNGVTSVWSFDEQTDVVPSEIQPKAP